MEMNKTKMEKNYAANQNGTLADRRNNRNEIYKP